MKKTAMISILGIFIFGILAFNVNQVDAATRVRGYTKSNGSYVAPHYKTSANSFKFDNYSSKGNYNPYTGKKGYKSW